MIILQNNNNKIILKNKNKDNQTETYFISYNSVIAKVNNIIDTTGTNNNYGLYLTSKWNYSQTTLKQLYEFIELYTTQRDDKTNNTIAYELLNVKNKKAYIEKQIDLGNIKILPEEEM